MNELENLAALTKKYAKVDRMGVVAVLSEDLGGMTYVARWVRTDSIKDFPEDASWADMTGENHE
jgi:hypothetical protein